MIRITLVSFIVVLLGFTPQPDIDYFHKSLHREIRKTWGIEKPVFEKITHAESIEHKYIVNGAFFELAQDSINKQSKFVYVGRVNSCRAGGCSISLENGTGGNSEYFDYFILFDHSHQVIIVKVFNYQATHGHEVSAKGWLKQFRGYNGTETLRVGKEIDAISGATISVFGITHDIQEKTKLLNILRP